METSILKQELDNVGRLITQNFPESLHEYIKEKVMTRFIEETENWLRDRVEVIYRKHSS